MFTKATQEAARTAERTPTTVTHEIRLRDGTTKALKYGRKMAIKLCCTECMGWETDPKDCTATLCPLYPFRGGTRASNGKGAIKAEQE